MMNKYFLGIDGGGTKTEVAVVDREGDVLLHFKEGGSNYQIVGIRGFCKVFRKILYLVERKFGSIKKFRCVFGISGLDTKKEEILLKSNLKKVGFTNFTMVNDALIALKAGILKERYGIVLVCGTGNILYGIGPKGIKRIGGLGYILGDLYSGPDIGRIALGNFFDLWWRGREKEAKIFLEEVLKFYKVKNIIELKEYIFDNIEKVYKNTGYLIQPIITSYKKKDKFIVKLLSEVVENFCEKIKKLSCEIGLDKHKNIKVVLSGGVFFHSDGIIEELIRKKLPEKFKCNTLKYHPVLGAILMAYQQENILNEEKLEKLLKAFKIKVSKLDENKG